MHNYPIYKNTRRDIIECATFLDDEICLKAYIKKEPSVVTYIDVANIHLKSDFDPDTTLIPGFTKRAVKYRDRDQVFVEICWNADESFTLRFPDEEGQGEKVQRDKVVIELVDDENTLERAMFHFSFLEKMTERMDKGKFRMTLYYPRSDEKEIMIRILSFGHQLSVISEGYIRQEIERRLTAQTGLLDQV